MKILLSASEVAPITGTGELSKAVGSLPEALEKLHVNADVIVPFFPFAKVPINTYKSFDLSVPFAGDQHIVSVYKTKLPGSNVDVFMLKNDRFFGSNVKHVLTEPFARITQDAGVFAFFDKAVVDFISSGFNTYDLIHCHDWHTGLIPHLLQDSFGQGRPKTLFTIHNIHVGDTFGEGSGEIVRDVGIVPGEHPVVDWDVSDGSIDFMLQGIVSADYVSTVSVTYAKEILTKEFSGTFSDILQVRSPRIAGIPYGIDYKSFPRYNDVSQWKKYKTLAKQDLQKKVKLNADPHKPIYSFVSQLDPNQKGLDILAENIPDIILRNGQLVLLGTGVHIWESRFKEIQSIAPGDISINIGTDDDLAAQIYSGSDFVIVPSKIEPCGLSQMIAMRYGALPVVRATGGLKDTVRDGVNGFTFTEYSEKALNEVLQRSRLVYGSQEYEKMVNVALNTDFSWDSRAREYVELYEKVINL